MLTSALMRNGIVNILSSRSWDRTAAPSSPLLHTSSQTTALQPVFLVWHTARANTHRRYSGAHYSHSLHWLHDLAHARHRGEAHRPEPRLADHRRPGNTIYV